MRIPSTDALLSARKRLSGHAHHTPVFHSRQFDERAGASIFFKAENLQRGGAFKFRGAFNAVSSLVETDPTVSGVVTHSSGNHAQALALAARSHGIEAHIVVPENAPRVKLAAIRSYGAQVYLCKPTLADREACAREVVAATGSAFVHAYDDHRIIAGQASAAAELIEQVEHLDLVVAPVGGGGLLSGTALTCSYQRDDHGSGPIVIGAEPTNADDAKRSLESGVLVPSTDPRTIADGLRTQLSELTFAIIKSHVERIVTVSEPEIIEAMRLVWERMKIIIEPSAAVAVAVVLSGQLAARAKRIGVILSGGNVDLEKLPWIRG